MQAESNKKLRDEVTRLESTRTELATDVESMARHLESERNRLRGALSDILKWVDENVQPANSLMGVRPKAAALGLGRGRGRGPGRRRCRAAAGGRRSAHLEPAECLGRRHFGSAQLALSPPSRGTVVLPLSVRSCMVTRSHGAVVVWDACRRAWFEGGRNDPSQQKHPGQAGVGVANKLVRGGREEIRLPARLEHRRPRDQFSQKRKQSLW